MKLLWPCLCNEVKSQVDEGGAGLLADSIRETAKTRANSPTPPDPALTRGVLVSTGVMTLPWLLPCPNVRTVEEAVDRALTDS